MSHVKLARKVRNCGVFYVESGPAHHSTHTEWTFGMSWTFDRVDTPLQAEK